METAAEVFLPVKGAWGLKGWTEVALGSADPDAVRHAMALAWKSVAPKKLAAAAGY
jgi:hypothetical protein